MKDVHFSYMVQLKLITRNGDLKLLQDDYPGVTDITLASRDFIDYDECVVSSKRFMDDMLAKANGAVEEPIYKLSTELNPTLTGQPTMSNDWANHELSRLWIYDKNMEGSKQIQAVGHVRIFKSRGSIQPELS